MMAKPNKVSIRTDASSVAKAAKALSALIHMASPEVSFDTYIVLRAMCPSNPNEQTKLKVFTSCGVLSAEVEVGNCQASSPLEEAEIIGTAQFFTSLDHASSVSFEQELNSGTVSYSRGSLKGKVAAVDPSTLVRTSIQVEGSTYRLPIETICNALDSTVFSSVDPNAKDTGVISRICVDEKALECTTYDSLCGALFRIKNPGIQSGTKIVLPNRLLKTLLSFTPNETSCVLKIDPGVALAFKTKTALIKMALREYPDIDVGSQIKIMAKGADEGISVDPKKVIDTVSSIISVGASDREIINLNIKHADDEVTFQIKSEAIECSEAITCSPLCEKKTMDIIVDSRRFLNFIKPCKTMDLVSIRHGSGRVIVRSPDTTFAFSVS